MNSPRPNRRNQQRRPQQRRTPTVDLWRTPSELPPAEPIAGPEEPGTLLRSLGDPPIGNGATPGHYFDAVVERAAALAAALALSADLLAQPPDE